MRQALAWLTLLMLVGFTTPPAAAETRDPRNTEPLYLVMDVSGSMEGLPLTAAREAAHAVIGGLQKDQSFALYTFPGGHKVVDQCPAGRFNIRPQRINQGNADFVVNLLSATGNTPTVPALKEIMRNVKNNGFERAQVVLVTDGEANCGSSNDVCSIVPLLVQQGIQLRINTVSLNNTIAGDASLACLARATGGTSTTAESVEQLVDAVKQSSAYAATLDVRVPDTLPRVTGRAKELAPTMTVIATATGTALIPDASLVVTFTSGDASRRVELDPYGIMPLGNLDIRASIERSLTLYPMATSDGPITWKVSLVSGSIPIASKSGSVRVTSGTTLDAAGSILKDAKHVVILGDSYSSGEGGGDYDGRGGSREWLCHRSANAYGRILFKDATMLACSGALTTDLTHYNYNYRYNYSSILDRDRDRDRDWVEPQLYELLKVTASDATPDLVLMSLGGNDSGFAEVVSGFVGHSTADEAPPVRPALEWSTLQSRLAMSYSQVNAIVNAPAAIAKRSGKVAQIVVLPYVRPVPVKGGDGCFALISQHELDLANDFAGSLNDIVRKAVAQAFGDGVPIHLASPVEYAFQPDHTICDEDESFAQTIRLDSPDASASAAWRALSPDQYQELMHPTAAGYAAEAASLVEWSRTASPKPLGKTPLDYKSISVHRYSRVWGDKQTKLGKSGIKLSLPSVVTEPGQSVDVSLCIEACKFAPTYVIVSSYSVPVPLGTLPVSPETGSPQGRIVLPDELPPGRHTIVLRGYTSSGQAHEARFEVKVWRTGSNRGIYLATLGGSCIAAAGLLAAIWRRGHR